MLRLHKLRIRTLSGYERVELCDLERAEYLIPFDDDETICILEGQVISSYEELITFAGQDQYKEKDILEITLLSVIAGG